MLGNSLWTERYRPKNLDDYVGSEDFVRKVKTWIENQDIPHLLLFSSEPGTGKTSAAKLIGNSLDADVLYINASDENNIETVRDKIKNFASSVGFGSIKIIILDECLKYDTLIHILRNGEEIQIPIENLLETTDLILSYNMKSMKHEYQPFKLKCVGDKEIYRVQLENGEIIECTDNHKWYVYNEFNDLIVVKTVDLYKYDHIVSILT